MKKNFLIVLLFLLIIPFLYILNFKNINFYGYNSPDENSIYSFTKNYSESGKLHFDISDNFDIPIIHTRGSLITEDRKLVTTKFLGFPILLGPILNIIGIQYINYINIILNFFILLIFYLFIRNIFGKKVSVFSVGLVLTFPAIIYNLNRGLFEEPLGILFIMFGYFLGLKSNYVNRYFILEIFFLGVSIIVRPIYLLYVLPSLIFKFKDIFKLYKDKKYTNIFKFVSFGLLVFLIVLSSLLISNNELYGGFLKTGYNLMYNSLFYTPMHSAIVSDEIINKTFIDYNKILLNLFLFFNLSLIILFSFILCLRKIKEYYSQLLIMGFILNFLYIFGISGSINIDLFNSPARYLLITFLLLIPYFVLFIFKIKSKLSLIIIFILIFLINFNEGFLKINKDSNLVYSLNKERNLLIENIPKNSYIFVSSLDKLLFPYYKTIIVNDEYYKKVNKNFYALVNAENGFDYVCNIINNNIIKGNNIYIYEYNELFVENINKCLKISKFNKLSFSINYPIYKLKYENSNSKGL